MFPTLVFQAEQGPPTWKTLRQLSRGLAEAVGYRMLESAFEVAFTRLHEQVGSGGLLTTSHSDIGAALGADEFEISEVLAKLQLLRLYGRPTAAATSCVQ